MNLTPEHLRASYEIYMKYGNSSSATVLSVLNKLRESDGKEWVVACAFGPGISLEMMVLRRRKEAPSPINGSGPNGANGVLHRDEAASNDDAVNGNAIPYTNGSTTTAEGPAIENGHATANGTSTEAVSTATNGVVANGASQVNGAAIGDGENGPLSSLPVEDLD